MKNPYPLLSFFHEYLSFFYVLIIFHRNLIIIRDSTFEPLDKTAF